jgi:hypothetical protein
MAHKLLVEFGDSPPESWDSARRAEASDKLFAAIAADRAGTPGAKLQAADRTKMLRIWLDIRILEKQAEESKAASADESAPAPKPAPRAAAQKKRKSFSLPRIRFTRLRSIFGLLRSLTIPDYVFLCVLTGLTVSVIWLGLHSVAEVQRIEAVKGEAEGLVSWLKETADGRGDAAFEPAACRKQDSSNWNDCLATLTAENGPLHGRVNHFEPKHPLMQRKCDPANWMTIGSIILEKGTMQPSGSYAYAPFEGTEVMSKDLVMRVIVCGRGFHLIKVATDLNL